jgi:mannose/fructose/N-acetylgalactosamine-specific phosphotransferase system component IIC
VTEYFVVGLFGALALLDQTSAFQIMISRPLVAGTLTGLALGQPGAGMALGCLVELLWLGAIPIGSVIPPDFTSATVAGVALALQFHSHQPSLSWEVCLVWGLIGAIPIAWIGGVLEQAQRRWHGRLLDRVDRELSEGDEEALGRGVAASLLVTAFRGAALPVVSLALMHEPMLAVLKSMFPPLRDALGQAYWPALLLGFIVLLDHFWERRWLGAAAVSFVSTVILLYPLRIPGRLVLLLVCAAAALGAWVAEKRFFPAEET